MNEMEKTENGDGKSGETEQTKGLGKGNGTNNTLGVWRLPRRGAIAGGVRAPGRRL